VRDWSARLSRCDYCELEIPDSLTEQDGRRTLTVDRILFEDGSVGAPALTYSSDPGTSWNPTSLSTASRIRGEQDHVVLTSKRETTTATFDEVARATVYAASLPTYSFSFSARDLHDELTRAVNGAAMRERLDECVQARERARLARLRGAMTGMSNFLTGCWSACSARGYDLVTYERVQHEDPSLVRGAWEERASEEWSREVRRRLAERAERRRTFVCVEVDDAE
jgi:hypothetical protein